MAFLLAIIVFAASSRLIRLDELPFGLWADEASIGLVTRQLLAEPGYRPLFIAEHSLGLHFAGLVALSFRAFGESIFSLRAVSAAFGLGSVAAAYFLGSELKGRSLGLMMAFLWSTARWSLTFSRMAMATSSAPFFVLVTMTLMLRGRRTGDYRVWGWAGIATGLGFNFHPSTRIMPLVALFFVIWWGVEVRRGRPGAGGGRGWRNQVGLLATGALLAAAPLIQFSIREPEVVSLRYRQVSIFHSEERTMDPARALLNNTAANLKMFTGQGDPNPRHNVPGQAVLDPLSGFLFLLGLGLSIAGAGRPGPALFLFLFALGLLTSILTVEIAAPNVQRAAAAMPAVLYFTAIGGSALWRFAVQQTGPLAPIGRIAPFLAGVALLFVATYNTLTYFSAQANNSNVWEAHSTLQTVFARQLREIDADNETVYKSMFLGSHSVLSFLAPQANSGAPLVPPHILPIHEPGTWPVIVFLDRNLDWAQGEIARLYPHTQEVVFANPDGRPLLTKLVIPAEDIKAVQGLTADYWPGEGAREEPAVSRMEKGIHALWPEDAPLALPFTARWHGILHVVDFGRYELLLRVPGAATLRLDGRPIIESIGPGQAHVMTDLAIGNHSLELEATGGGGNLRLAWRKETEEFFQTIPAAALYHSPQLPTNGLLASFYPGGDWSASPVVQRIDPRIDTAFHLLPAQRPYSARWEGQIQAPVSGIYAFGLRVTGQAQLFLDGLLTVEAEGPTDYVEGTVYLEGGRHPLELLFLDHLAYSRLHLYWTPPGEQPSVVPGFVLSPPG